MRVLVTGGTGFVGAHLARACLAAGDEVFVASRSMARAPEGARALAADVKEPASLLAAIEAAKPERVFHLAGHASVKTSFGVEREIIETNVVGTLNVLAAVKEKAPAARVLYVGSAEEYGRSEPLPWREDARLIPISPYGVSRAAASLVAQRFAFAEGLHVVRTRSFNHTGAGQSVHYVVPSFAQQLVQAKKRGERRVEVRAGDLSVRRDFSGVSGVVRAYRALIEKGASGEVYNVCSGVALPLSELLARLARIVGVEAVAVLDPERVRRIEVPVLLGDASRLESAVGFSLEGSLDPDLEALIRSLS